MTEQVFICIAFLIDSKPILETSILAISIQIKSDTSSSCKVISGLLVNSLRFNANDSN